jgi:hypothetical protein
MWLLFVVFVVEGRAIGSTITVTTLLFAYTSVFYFKVMGTINLCPRGASIFAV